MFMLTATPINNSFLDLLHLIELFTQRQDDYFKSTLGIHSLTGHFRKMEKSLETATLSVDTNVNSDESNAILRNDDLVNELVVQRSRAYVKKSLSASESGKVLFPKRLPPIVAKYSLRKSYGKLIDDFVDSFYRKDNKTGRIVNILALPVYSPYKEIYYKGDVSKIDEMKRGRYPAVRNTLTPESRKLYLSNIQPAAMLWRVMYLKPLGEFSCVLRRKSRIKRSDAVSVQIIHDQNDFFSIGISPA